MREKIKKLFKGSGIALLTMFIWELVEEAFENLIAYTISNTLTLFITKALSTLGIILITQGIKVSLKRFLVPIVKTFTYKEGLDKMSKFKEFLTKLAKSKLGQFIKYLVKSNPKETLATLMNMAVSTTLGFTTDYMGEFVNDIPALYICEIDIVPYVASILVFIIIQLGIKGSYKSNAVADAVRETLKEEKAERKAEKLELKQKAIQEKADAELLEKAKVRLQEKKAEQEKLLKEQEENAKIERLVMQLEQEEKAIDNKETYNC